MPATFAQLSGSPNSSGAQEKHQHERQADERVGMAQVELGHRQHPAQRRAERRGERAPDPWVGEQPEQERAAFRRVVAGRRPGDLPLHDQLPIDRQQDRCRHIGVAHAFPFVVDALVDHVERTPFHLLEDLADV